MFRQKTKGMQPSRGVLRCRRCCREETLKGCLLAIFAVSL